MQVHCRDSASQHAVTVHWAVKKGRGGRARKEGSRRGKGGEADGRRQKKEGRRHCRRLAGIVGKVSVRGQFNVQGRCKTMEARVWRDLTTEMKGKDGRIYRL